MVRNASGGGELLLGLGDTRCTRLQDQVNVRLDLGCRADLKLRNAEKLSPGGVRLLSFTRQ